MEEKRNKMAINSKDLPDDIYEIFKDKAAKRALTAYIIELYRDSQNAKLIFEKLDSIDKKIDNISTKQTPIEYKDTEDIKNTEDLQEGTIMQVGRVEGSIDPGDIDGDDF